jgi:hypothetical protein
VDGSRAAATHGSPSPAGHPSRAVLDEIITRCERHGIRHAEPYDTPAGTILDVPDPDGAVLRCYHFTAGTAGFTGIESRGGAIVGSCSRPRLPAG